MRAERRSRPPGRPPTLLIVDDEDDVLASLKALLAFAMPDVHVLCAQSPDEARSLFGEHRVDAVLVDQRLADARGLDLVAEFFKLDPGVPSILMTAFPRSGVVEEARRSAHVLGIARKPFETPVLLDLLRQALPPPAAAFRPLHGPG